MGVREKFKKMNLKDDSISGGSCGGGTGGWE
jgi:hypothetical protein